VAAYGVVVDDEDRGVVSHADSLAAPGFSREA
jgi:hypothetical protein